MDAVNFTVPTSWNELSDKQLRYVYRLIADDFSIDEVKAHCFLRWSGCKILSRYGDYKFLCRLDKKEFAVAPRQIAEQLASLDWIGQLPLSPIRFSRIGKHGALPADFQGVPFETFLVCENLYQGFLHTQQDAFLDQIGAQLYPGQQKFDATERINIFYWFASLKDFFAKRFNDFLQPLNSGSENLLGSSPNIGAQLQEAMDAQIRALTKGDITKEREILALDTWRALTELNAQAKEYKQLNAKLNVK